MDMTTPITVPLETPSPSGARSKKRRGVVIVAVLVVIVILSLAGYHYTDMATSEFKASVNAHKLAQARSFADSGIHYTAALLGRPENLVELNGNPWSNSARFANQEIKADGKTVGYFSIIAPPDPGEEANQTRYGVTCEASKININAVFKLDTTGELLFTMLMKLPDMTEDIANSIVDWIDPDSDARSGGAESDYYLGQNPAYRAKNGPLDSIDELLLVKGMTRELLYGNDTNRNGIADPNEQNNVTFYRGWSAYLTVYSREQNRTLDGKGLVFLNNTDLEQLYNGIVDTIGDEDLAKFIVLARQNPMADINSAPPKKAVEGSLSEYQPKFDRKARYSLISIYDLINVRVVRNNVIYNSPLNDVERQRALLPRLLVYGMILDLPEIPARVNVNTAPREVLLAIPGLTEADVEKIIGQRPKLSTEEKTPDIYATQAWLLTESQFSLDTLKGIDRYIGGTSQVYRVQAVGWLEGKGPAVRIEAIIDTNAGRPRIVAWRDMTDLGKGINDTPAP